MAAEDGPSVAIVGKDGTVTLRRVTIARDEGKTVLVSVGLKPGDKVIDSPPDSLRTGDRVRTAAPEGKGAKGTGGNG
jgi:multidrug efflux pump subunit AcrA (membrane-fusion protein)